MPENAHPPATASPPKAVQLGRQEKRQLVQRVLESGHFSKAPAMRAFLQYVIDKAELGQADQLKEQTIGAEVLGRKLDYEPAKDNIVRVRANELRGRLARYFASEGIQEPVVLTIPKGGYAPEFVAREALVLDSIDHAQKAAEPPVAAPAKPWPLWPLAVLLTALVGASIYLVTTRYGFESRSASDTLKSSRELRDFWSQFFAKPAGILTVMYSDSGIALWQRLNDKDLNLGDYLSHKYIGGHNNELLEIASQRATSPADINATLRIQTVAALLGGQVSAQFARNASADLLHRGSLVLIGSRRSDPWVEIYEPNLNFQLRIDPDTRSPQFYNRAPQPHESLTYSIPDLRETGGAADEKFIEEAEEKEFDSYGVVALMKGCGANRVVLLLEGLNMQATQAAGDLVTDPQLLEHLLQAIGHVPGTTVAPFEVLFRITSLPGGYENPQLIASRVHTSTTCISD